MDSKVFGQFIARTRKEKQMTQAELAGIIGVTDKAVSRWERGIGFPDINTLEPLARALDVTVPELMRSEKTDMNKEKLSLSEGELTEMMSGAVEMEKENQRQNKAALWIGGTVTIAVALLIQLSALSSRASLGGALFAGAMTALTAVSLYYFARNRRDKSSRAVYGFFLLAGLGVTMALFSLMGVDSLALLLILYLIFALFIGILSR